MSLADRLEEQDVHPNAGCTLGLLLAGMGGDELAAFWTLQARLSDRRLSELLAEEGYDGVSYHTAARHRRRLCQCEAAGLPVGPS